MLKTRWMRTQDNDCDMLKSIDRANSRGKSCGFPKPRPMAWAGMTTHLRGSHLTARRRKNQRITKTQADGLGWYYHAPSGLASDCTQKKESKDHQNPGRWPGLVLPRTFGAGI